MNQYIERAQLLIQQHRIEQAEEQLRMALGENTSDATAHALLALCLLERKKYDEATDEAQQAIHHEPDEPLGFYALATVMQERNRLKEAYSAIQEAIRLQPWNESHFGRLAGIEFQRSRWNECLTAAEQGLEFDPEDVECTNLRAMALVKLGRRDEAGQTIEAALANAPDNAITHANLGWTLLHQREPKRAMEHFREALRLDPNLEWARAGIIESMKARHFIYRWMLAWFLWMSRFPPRVQILLVLGIVFGNQILATICNAVPALVPIQGPIVLAYLLFAWMTWVAPTLFNLVLCLSPFGRMALNTKEKVGAAMIAACMLVCVGIGVTGMVATPGEDFVTLFWQSGLLFLGLVIPLTTTLRHEGNKRLLMGAWSAGVAFCMVMAVVALFTMLHQFEEAALDIVPNRRALELTPEEVKDLRAKIAVRVQPFVNNYIRWWTYGLNGIVISTWLGLGLAMAPQRK